MFDDDDFNRRLFYPRRDTTPAPPGATDSAVAVPGASLHVRLHRAAGARATVLLFHGNGEVVADYDRSAAPFARIGAELAVVDFRGYGDSSGEPTLRTIMADAHRVLDALAPLAPGPLIVMGRSLGSACANELYGARAGDDVAGFVLESGFTDLAGLIARRGLRPPRQIDPAARRVFDPLLKLAKVRERLLVLHGGDDDLVPLADARAALAAAQARHKRLVVVEGHGHNDLSAAPAYWRALADFVTDCSTASA